MDERKSSTGRWQIEIPKATRSHTKVGYIRRLDAEKYRLVFWDWGRTILLEVPIWFCRFGVMILDADCRKR